MTPKRSGSADSIPSLVATPIRRGDFDHHARSPPRARAGEPRPWAGLGPAPAAAAARPAEAGRRSGLAGTGLVTLGGCADDSATSSTSATPGSDGAPAGALGGGPGGGPPGGGGAAESTETSDTANGEMPEETAGPYPGDGSNGANVLTESGVVRSDITSSFGSSHHQGRGRPARHHHDHQRLRQRQAAAWPAPRSTSGTATGRASTPSTPQAIENENYLRGVQETDAKGQVTFTTIFPACYSGRWPHIHFEVYPSLAKATSSATRSPPPRWR